MKFVTAVLMIAAVISCSSPPPKPAESTAQPSAAPGGAGQYPNDYQLRIISWLRMNSDDPDRVRVLSIEPPRPTILQTDVPEKDLAKGDELWESLVLTQGRPGDPPGPTYHRFYFKDGVIRAVDIK
jgi:hypothetical protein